MPDYDKPGSKGSAFLRGVIWPVALFLLVTAVYLPALHFDFVYDDHVLILGEPGPKSLSDVFSVFTERHWDRLAYYRPVSRLTMVVQKYLHGDNPAPYHLFNVLAMACLAVLTFALLRAPRLEIPRPLALIGAGLVALHPVASSTVYPICSGRESLLPALFAIGATRCYLSAGKPSYFAALAFLALALLSKEQAVVVPILFLWADILGVSAAGRPREILEWVRRYGPVLVVLMVYFAVRSQLFGVGDEHRLVLSERPFGPLLSLVFAVQTTLVPPAPLAYEPTVGVWASTWRGVVSMLGALLVAAGAYRCWSMVRARFLFWLGWAVMPLLPTANILDQEARFAERYLLLSLVGVVGMVATLTSVAWDRSKVRLAIAGAALVFLVVCAAISFQRGRYYRDDITFFRQWVATNPESGQAHLWLGYAFAREQEWDKAVTEYRETLRMDPNHVPALSHLGEALAQQGQLTEAVVLVRRAAELDPDYPGVEYRLGEALLKAGDLPEAAIHLDRARALRPNDASVHYQLGKALFRLGNLDEARRHFTESLRLRPDGTDALNDLGIVIAQSGGPNSVSRSQECFRRAIEIDPSFADAHFNLGVSHWGQGNLRHAEACFETVLRLDPGHPFARETLDRVRAAMRDGRSGPDGSVETTLQP